MQPKWLVMYDENSFKFFETELEAVEFAKDVIRKMEETGKQPPPWFWDLCVLQFKYTLGQSMGGLYLEKVVD